MAEKTMESEVIKKYHFSMLALSRSRKSYSKKMAAMLTKYKKNPNSVVPHKAQNSIYGDTWNKKSFKPPTM